MNRFSIYVVSLDGIRSNHGNSYQTLIIFTEL